MSFNELHNSKKRKNSLRNLQRKQNTNVQYFTALAGDRKNAYCQIYIFFQYDLIDPFGDFVKI